MDVNEVVNTVLNVGTRVALPAYAPAVLAVLLADPRKGTAHSPDGG